ncbi:hypothetical protein DFS34DRAFT_647204 [Phlyctochytrium arcticum]|nr:hypothetical protein DFS34DRAFT_647204 [Phlyctochytrium arcticum]
MARIKRSRQVPRDTSNGSSVSFGSTSVTSHSPAGTATVKSESAQAHSQKIPASTRIRTPRSKDTSDCYNIVSEVNSFESSGGEDETGHERADDEFGGMEEVSSEAEPHKEYHEEKKTRKSNKQFRERKPRNVTPATLRNYVPCRKKFIAWCTEQNFSDGCWVSEEKIIGFCQDQLISKGHYLHSYSSSTVGNYIAAFMHLYHEQVREGLHNYTNPRASSNLAALLKSLKRPRNETHLNSSDHRGCSTLADEQMQIGGVSRVNNYDGKDGSSAVGLQNPQITSVSGVSELTNTMNALYNATMERINGIENTISSLKTSTASSNDDENEHTSTGSQASPPNDAADDVQDLATLFDTLWKELENNSGRYHEQIKELGQVTKRAILSIDSTGSSKNSHLQDM